MNQLLDSSKRHDDVDIGKEEQPKILWQTLMIIYLSGAEARWFLLCVMYSTLKQLQDIPRKPLPAFNNKVYLYTKMIILQN